MDANFATHAATVANVADIEWAHPCDVARTHPGATSIYDTDCTAVYSVLATRVTHDGQDTQKRSGPARSWSMVSRVTLAHCIQNACRGDALVLRHR